MHPAIPEGGEGTGKQKGREGHENLVSQMKAKTTARGIEGLPYSLAKIVKSTPVKGGRRAGKKQRIGHF